MLILIFKIDFVAQPSTSRDAYNLRSKKATIRTFQENDEFSENSGCQTETNHMQPLEQKTQEETLSEYYNEESQGNLEGMYLIPINDFDTVCYKTYQSKIFVTCFSRTAKYVSYKTNLFYIGRKCWTKQFRIS